MKLQLSTDLLRRAQAIPYPISVTPYVLDGRENGYRAALTGFEETDPCFCISPFPEQAAEGVQLYKKVRIMRLLWRGQRPPVPSSAEGRLAWERVFGKEPLH